MQDSWDRLWARLAAPHARDVVYVYRINEEGKPIRPYLLKSSATDEIPAILRDEYGGGAFQILIRRGKKMLLASRIDIEAASSML